MAEYITVAQVSAVPANGALQINVQGQEIGLWNIDGTIYAIGDVCTHEEAYLSEGEYVGDCRIMCPLHGAEFDLRSGAAKCLPATEAEPVYPVRIVGDDIQIEI